MGKLNPVIVIIEDDPHIRRFLRRGLEAHGFEIHEAETGQLGLKTAETQRRTISELDTLIDPKGRVTREHRFARPTEHGGKR